MLLMEALFFWWNHSSSGACGCFLPRKMVWCASWSSDRLLQKDPSQRIVTKCHICHFREGEPEYSSSKFGVTWKQGNRKSLQKDIVDFVFYNCNIISNSSMQKIIRTSLEVYIGWKRLQNKEISRRRENIFLLFSAGFALSGCEEELGKEATATSAPSFLVRKCSRTVVGSWTMCVLK